MPTTTDAVLLDVGYRNIRGRSVPLLSFVSDGEALTVLDWGFRPYFLAALNVRPGDSPDAVARNTERRIVFAANKHRVPVCEIGRGKLRLLRDDKYVLAVTVNNTGDVVALRDLVRSLDGVDDVYEADILFHNRYIIDKQLVPCGRYRVTHEDGSLIGLEHLDNEWTPTMMGWDIEAVTDGGFPDPDKHPIILISCASEAGGEVVFDGGGDEAELLRQFVSHVTETNPDVLVTYNGDKFDWPYLARRAKLLGVELALGRDGDYPYIKDRIGKRGKTHEVSLRGRVCLDAYKVVARDVDNVTIKIGRLRVKGPKDLKTVAEFLGVLKKEDREIVPPDEMAAMWQDDPDRFKQYCIDDSVAALGLGQKLIDSQVEFSRLTRLTLHDTISSDRGNQVENYLMFECKRDNQIIPNKNYKGKSGATKKDSEKYDGADVLDPVPGLHEGVSYLDFASLYPTIMITHNIGPDTLAPPDETEGVNVNPVLGHRFYKEPVSFVVRQLLELLTRRKAIKKQMATATGGEYRRLYELQYTTKVLANSFYGYLGWERARWFVLECAESVTSWGRYYLEQVADIAKSHGVTVIYGDTDSVHVINPTGNPGVIEDIIVDSNEKLPVTLELEETLDYAIYLPQKKRYCGLEPNGDIFVKGLEVRRGDWCRLAQEAQAAVIEHLLTTRDIEATIGIAKTFVEETKNVTDDWSKYVLSVRLSKSPYDYGVPFTHTEAAKRATKAGYGEFSNGDFVRHVIVAPQHLGQRAGAGPTACSATVDMARDKNMSLNVDYYLNNQVLPALMRILSVVGVTEDAVLGRPQQKTLDDLF